MSYCCGGGIWTGGSGQGYSNRAPTGAAEEDTFQDSFHLLMELVTQEPTIQSCFRVITSTCLAKGICIEVRGQKPTAAFQRHINRYYTDFCEQAIRTMFACGFVPWRLRRLPSGDIVPEALPLGTFSWEILEGNADLRKRQDDARRSYGPSSLEPNFNNNSGKKDGKASVQSIPRHGGPVAAPHPARGGGASNFKTQGEVGVLKPPLRGNSRKPEPETPGSSGSVQGKEQKETPFLYTKHQRALASYGSDSIMGNTKTLQYGIRLLCSSGLRVEDIEIYEFMQPNYHITATSSIMATVSSPMAHLVVDYRTLRRAQLQREYADLWNCRAKMVCSYQSAPNRYSLNEGGAILAGSDWGAVPQNRGGMMSDAAIPSDPEYNVQARDHIMESVVSSKQDMHRPVVYTMPKNSKLEAVPKLDLIQDVGSIQGKFAKDATSLLGVPFEIIGGGYHIKEGAKKSLENTRIFTTNMMGICRHLQDLLTDVYVATYGDPPADVKVTVSPTPRIEVGTVDDIVKLMDMGLVSFENAMDLSNMLLGMDLKQNTGKEASAGQFSRAFITPSHRKDLLLSQAALVTSKKRKAEPEGVAEPTRN